MKYNVRLESKAVDGRPVCRYESVSARSIIEAWDLAEFLAYGLNCDAGKYVVAAVGRRPCQLPQGITEAPCSQ